MPWEKMSFTPYRKLWKMTDYDLWLDRDLDDYYSEEEDSPNQDWDDYEPNPYPDEELD